MPALTPAVQLSIAWELAELCPSAQDGGPQIAMGTTAAGQLAFEEGGIAFDHPTGRAQHHRAAPGQLAKPTLDGIARWAQHMRQVGVLVD